MTTNAGDAVLKAFRLFRLAMTNAGINPSTDMVIVLDYEKWCELQRHITQGDGLMMDFAAPSDQFKIFGTTFICDHR